MYWGRNNTSQNRVGREGPWVISSMAVGCFAIVAAFFAAGEGEFTYFFMSDSLYLPSIYRDLFQMGGHLRDWSLNAAPNFFPDMPLYFGLEWGLGSFIAASYVFPMVQFIGIVGFFGLALRIATGLRDGRPLAFGAMMVAGIFLWSNFGWDFSLAFHLLINSFHQGAFLNTLMALCLLLWGVRRKEWLSVVLLFLLAALASASDRSFWPLFSIPAFMVLLLTSLRSGQRGRVLLLALVIAAGSATGIYLLRSSGWNIENPYQFMAFNRIGMSWHNFIDQFHRLFKGNDLNAYLMWVAVLALLHSMWKGTRALVFRARTEDIPPDPSRDARFLFYLFIPLACVCNLIAPVLNGTYDGDDSLRYNFAAILLALLSSALIIAELGNRGRTIATGMAIAGVLAAALWTIAPAHGRMQALLNYQPERSVTMDEIAKEQGLRYGAAEYWDAKVMTMFSHVGLEVAPVGPDQTLYVHVLRRGAYYAPEQNRPLTFVVISRPEKNGITEVKGLRQRSVEQGDVKVVITEPWIFDPSTLEVTPLDR